MPWRKQNAASGLLSVFLFVLAGCTGDRARNSGSDPGDGDGAVALPDAGHDASDGSAALDASDTDADADVDRDAASEPHDADAGPAPCRDYQALRAELLQAIESAECSAESCPLVDVVAEPAAAQTASLGKRILLIDDQGVVVPAATRYRRRTLAYVERTPQGVYEEFSPTFSIARDALPVLQRLDAEAPEAKARELELDDAFFAKFKGQALPAQLDGHGTDLLPFLAEHIPDSQFVASDTPMNFPYDCALLQQDAEGDAAFSALSGFVDAMQNSLTQLIQRYDLHAIHLSWGLDHINLTYGFQAVCNAAPSRAVTTRIMLLYADLFRALTQLETLGADGHKRKVVLFQAGEGAEDGIAHTDTLDCTDITRRVRVYDVAYDGYAVPAEGSYDTRLLRQLPAGKNLDCIDVFMVMGYRDIFMPPRQEAFFAYRPLGLGTHRPAWPSASSFANPVALAHYFFVQAQTPDADSDAWIAQLTRGASKPILDPLLHGAFAAGLHPRLIAISIQRHVDARTDAIDLLPSLARATGPAVVPSECRNSHK